MLIESLSVFTPLGIRFWDPVINRPVRDGLDVRAHPATAPRQQRRAFRTASGNYAFQGLPCLHAVEYPRDADAALLSPPFQLPFVVTVVDERRRFLPVAFSVDLPLPYRGLYEITLPESPPQSPPPRPLPGFYLFSAPARVVPPAFAAIRARLLDAQDQTPASHAVLEVEFDEGGVWYGMADTRGEVLILCPYPPFRKILHPSPPASPPAPVAPQQWMVTIRTRYDPSMLQILPGASQPDLSTVCAQPDGRLWATSAGPPADSLVTELLFDQTLVLATEGLAALQISAQDAP